ncbi:hypothetical protein LB507_005007 [Fusarium sp. FIESC RH6]|nr:hypothetical protein LB507_005007 [Fusarium sp. FIESC RH6]
MCGLLLIAGGVGEWILGKRNPSTMDSLPDVLTGNTFPSTIFFTFGGFWLAFGTTIVPGSGAYSTYSTTGTAADGLSEPAFYATFSFFLVAMAILCSVYSIASIRTNIALFTILVLLIPCFGCLSASFFALAQGSAGLALKYQHVGAGLLLAVTFIGWYMLTSMLLLSVDFPVILPLGDLSTIIRGRSETKPISKGV